MNFEGVSYDQQGLLKLRSQSVRSVDLMPTILGLADQAPGKVQGSDLSKDLASPKPAPLKQSEERKLDRMLNDPRFHKLLQRLD